MPYSEIPNDEPSDHNNTPDSSISSSGSSLNINNQLREYSLSSNSSADNNPNNDEENYHQPYLLPIQLPQPTEPTLEELLRNVTGRLDLDNVQALKFRVISLTVSLHRLSSYMPNLISLNLEGSVLNSLRDLGIGLTKLNFLNVSNCGLSSLDGTNGITTVRSLIADNNMIQLIGPVQNLPFLKIISLKENRIRNLPLVTFLGVCEVLEEVDLRGNPVINEQLYRQTMRQTIPSLQILDGRDITDGRNDPPTRNSKANEYGEGGCDVNNSSMDISEDSTASTLSDEPFSLTDLTGITIEMERRQERPATSQSNRKKFKLNEKGERIRPATAGGGSSIFVSVSDQCSTSRRSLTSGEPVCGSIIGTIREQRKWKKSHLDDNTLSINSPSQSSRSSISSTSSGSISIHTNRLSKTLSREFPMHLPSQTQIELDLGVIDGITVPSTDNKIDDEGNCSSDSNNSLEKIRIQWRNECNRKKNFEM